jgi:hypothetical protein
MKAKFLMTICAAAAISTAQAQLSLTSSAVTSHMSNAASEEFFCENKSKRTHSDIVFGTGINNWHNTGSTAGFVHPGIGQSWFVDLGKQYRTRIGKENSPVFLRWGYGFVLNSYDLGQNTLTKEGDKTVFTALGDAQNYRSTVRNTRLYIPLSLDFKLSKKFYIGAGGYAGIRLGTGSTKVKYKVDGEKTKNIDRTNLNYNLINYGLQASVGTRDFKLYGRYDLSEQFAANGPQGVNPWSAGAMWFF